LKEKLVENASVMGRSLFYGGVRCTELFIDISWIGRRFDIIIYVRWHVGGRSTTTIVNSDGSASFGLELSSAT